MATCEIQWLIYLLSDLRIFQTQAVPLLFDNQSTLYVTENLVFHDRTKHLEIDCHLVRERYLAGVLKSLPIRIFKSVGRCTYKGHKAAQFKYLINQLHLFLNLYGGTACGGLMKLKKQNQCSEAIVVEQIEEGEEKEGCEG